MIRLLYDENLSASLITQLRDIFPDAIHIRELGYGGAADAQVWTLAKEHDAVLVSRDEDFRAMSGLFGPPPKVVWLDVGNARTAQVAALLRASRASVERLVADREAAYLVLALAPPSDKQER